MSERVNKADMACNKPRRTPGHPKKSHVVKACFDGKEKLIRFGEQGASTAGKPKEGESERMKTKRASFKARHAKNIAKGPSSPAYWANKVKWAEGGEVKMAAGGSAALALIEQMRRSGARSQEFDPVLVAMREQRARPARRSVMPQPAPRMPEPQAEALPLPPVPPAMRPDENPPPEAPRSPLRFDEGNPHVATAIRMAERYGLPTNIFLSLVQQESRFDPNARSRRGAIGLGQLMPGTARELGVDPTDPEQNLEGSARYLRRMLDQFGDMSLALAAYNAGPGTVRRAGNTIPNIRETQNYVPSILRRAGVSGPEGFAEGGLADLDEKYAEGGPVITPYDPEEVEALAGSIEQPEGYAEGGRVGRVAGAIRRAVTRRAPEPEAAERALPPVENSRLTQVATTGGTYEKARDVLRERGVEGPVLDYGAGRGHGSAILGGDSFEPYPGAGFRPTYTDPGEIPADRYAGLVNLNVLNVLPPEVRDEAVRNMGRVLEPQGTAVITTRGRDVMSARGTPGPEPMSLVIGEGDRARYQKGFTPAELREYLQRVLGPRFDVENLDLGPAGALVRRLYGAVPAALLLPDNEPGRSLEDLDRKYAEGGAVSDEDAEYDRRLLSRMKEQTGRVTEPTRAEQMQALRTAGRSAAEGVADVLLPQSPLDFALMAALGPGGRAARLAGAGALAALEPSEAEASRLRRLIRAYHGSPHKFDEFDIRKIGTGEGAQAYGRGLYFAENEDIARSYRDKLAGGPLTTEFSIGARVPMIRRGDPVDYSPRAFDPQSIAKAELQEQLLMLEPELRTMADDVQRAAAVRRTIMDLASDPGADPQSVQYLNSVLRGLEEGSTPLRYSSMQPGHMYEVDLNASPRDFLNWDVSLSRQAPEVQESLARLDPSMYRRGSDDYDPSEPGQMIYQRLQSSLGELETPNALMRVGIPGTRYLDAGSRGVGGGTYNYAVFDPEIIDIVRRYAKGGLAELENKYAEGGEVSAMTYDPDAVDALVKEIEAEYV